jgi:sigma-B regulation protein RsbU (phosphoserine phosphatase)
VLIPSGLPLPQLVERANRIFSDSTLPTHYATLVVGRAGEDGALEICNGGHLPPLHVQTGAVTAIAAAALPVGMFHDQEFRSTQLTFAPGDSLVIYTDGFTEAEGQDGLEYGAQRLSKVLEGHHGHAARKLVDVCVSDLTAFRNGSPRVDDQTLMALNLTLLQH